METLAQQSRTHSSAKNLYRHRWAVQIGEPAPRVVPRKRVEIGPIRVVRRFPGGMVYESSGHTYVLAEEVFGGYPFLLVFRSSGSRVKQIPKPEERYYWLSGVPEAVMTGARIACEQAASAVKLPEELHNVELDVTNVLEKAMALPDGWALAKAILKVTIRDIGQVTCDCDVDGPCGYCCDICDGDSCYSCDCYDTSRVNPIDPIVVVASTPPAVNRE